MVNIINFNMYMFGGKWHSNINSVNNFNIALDIIHADTHTHADTVTLIV